MGDYGEGDSLGKDLPVDVEDVNPVGLQLLERVAEGDVQGTLVVAAGVNAGCAFPFVVTGVVGRELGGDDHLVSIVPLLHPLTYKNQSQHIQSSSGNR